MSLTNFVTSIFPPPTSLLRPALGIDISDASLKYLAFKRQRQHLQIAAHGMVPLPASVVVGGLVEKPDILAVSLREVCEKTGFSCVNLALPEERAYVFETTIPSDTRPKEVHEVVALHLEENVPLPIADAVFDYQVLPAKGQQESYPVAVTVYARRVVDGYLKACHLAQVTPLLFEVESQSAARSVIPHNSQGAFMIVDLGASRTGVSIVEEGVVRYTSTFDRGSSTIFENLSRTEKKFTKESFITCLNTIGLSGGSTAEAVLPVVSHIKDELLRHIDYWNQRALAKDHEEISSLILCGGAANIRGLTTYFNTTLELPTKTAAVWQNAFKVEEKIPDIFSEDALAYAQAIGLALATHTRI